MLAVIAARHLVNFGDPRLPDRFWDKCIPEPNSGCWLWLARTDKDGYGDIAVDGRKFRAHRFAFERLAGAIPVGLVIDHKCRVHSCVNPAHLEPVTRRENTRRGLSGLLTTHCPAGHAYDAENTYLHRRSDGGERRFCRACNRAAQSRRAA